MIRRNLFSACVVAMGLLASFGVVRTASAELVAYYNFDEGSGTTLKNLGTAGSVLDGVITGATYVDGKYGKALSFDGSSYAKVAANAVLEFSSTQSFTAMAWINIGSGNSGWGAIFSKGRAVSDDWWGLYENGGSSWSYSKVGGWQIGADATSGTWVNVAIAQDAAANTETLYVNGVAVASYAGTNIHNLGGDLLFGGWLAIDEHGNPMLSEGFKGLIDEFRLYNTALSASEIAAAAAAPVPEPSAMVLSIVGLVGLLAYAWRKQRRK